MRMLSGREPKPAAERDESDASPAAPAEPEGPAAADAVAQFWRTRFTPADRLAVQYADRYRSGYVWIFLFATLSVALGASALVSGLLSVTNAGVVGGSASEMLTIGFTASEMVLLCLALLMVITVLRRDWHEHSIEFRILAELYRKQETLGPLGWTLPITAVREVAETDGHLAARGAWVAWLFEAEQRAASLPTGDIADAARGAARRGILEWLISEQQRYHVDRRHTAAAASARLAKWGEWIFGAVLACVTVKLALELIGAAAGIWPLGWAATVLPAVSAAFVGIRAYAELPMLAVQSSHMAAALATAEQRVHRLNKTRPFLSQDLGAEAAAVATLMLQDLDGWARLFHVKSLEAGG